MRDVTHIKIIIYSRIGHAKEAGELLNLEVQLIRAMKVFQRLQNELFLLIMQIVDLRMQQFKKIFSLAIYFAKDAVVEY